LSPESRDSSAVLDRYRSYLLLLARAQLDPRKGDRVEASDIVQQTLLEAHEKQEQFRGQTQAQQAVWLRKILANNLADAFRGIGRAKRDIARERSLDASINESSMRLGNLLADDQSSPSQHMDGEERALRLADALAELPEPQREALVLQYWQGWSLSQIAEHLNRTPVAVAGLLKRALRQLREHLCQPADEHSR